jgi:uncharacterized membrane protein YgaE (UPF0421/DUF939 family)
MPRLRRGDSRAAAARWGRAEVEQVAEVLTGRSGPGQRFFAQSRRWGVGERVVKSALAAGLAWFLITHFFDHPRPILAPLTALYAIQVTVAQSLAGMVHRILGLVAGLLVAFAVELVIGPNSVAIGIGVLIALAIGVRLKLDTVAITQLATTAVVGIAGGNVDPHWRFLSDLAIDTGVGATVGVMLNLLIAPPSHVDGAFQSLEALSDEVGEIYRDTAKELAQGLTGVEAREQLERARRTVGPVASAMAALSRADESLRYTIVSEERRRALERARRMTRALEHAAIQGRIIHRSLNDAISAHPDIVKTGWLSPGSCGASLARLMAAGGDAVTTLGAIPAHPEEIASISVRLSALRSAHDLAVANARQSADLLASGDWVIAGEILGAAAQLLGDLELAAMA